MHASRINRQIACDTRDIEYTVNITCTNVSANVGGDSPVQTFRPTSEFNMHIQLGLLQMYVGSCVECREQLELLLKVATMSSMCQSVSVRTVLYVI